MVDLWMITHTDLNVVDGIVGREGGALTVGSPRRANWVLAGRDPVATDLVAAQLMGFNPDDMEFAELAWRRGLGPRYIENVTVRGDAPAALALRFEKAGEAYGRDENWRYRATYGMGARYWRVRGPESLDHAFTAAALATLASGADADGWSEVTFFHDDEIDLSGQTAGVTDCAMYAFTRLYMPVADSVRYWAGSDEGMTVWVDGEQVYSNQRRRRHRLGQDREPGYLDQGVHQLLVRMEQRWGPASFSFNVCEPVDDRRYAGNRYPGLRYFVTEEQGAEVLSAAARRKAATLLPAGFIPE